MRRTWTGFAIVLIAALAAGAIATTAGGQTERLAELRRIDRTLAGLCRQIQQPGSDGWEEARRLWQRRVVILQNLPPNRQDLGLISQQCLTMLKADAERTMQRVEPKAKRARKAARNGEVITSGPTLPPPAPPPPLIGKSTITGKATPPPPPALAPPPIVMRKAEPPPARAPAAAEPIQDLFPWPPPDPSTRRTLAIAQLAEGPAATTWGQAADRIVALLRNARFESWGFYRTPGGFAVVTRVEQLDSQSGMPLAGTARFPSEPRVASTNIFDALFTIRRPEGFYRTFAFVLTTDVRPGAPVTDEEQMLRIARGWAMAGAPDLPNELRGETISDAHRLFVLVYEFEHAVGGATHLIAPSRWSFDDHVRSAGIVIRP